jgi:hypothetical protein
MIADAIMPRPGVANGIVPKNGIGIAFCIAGVVMAAIVGPIIALVAVIALGSVVGSF